MRFNKLDLNLLVALDAMLKEQSISRAAERLHITQSAMSNALARLREYFNDDLLVQVGRRMELTPRAESLQEAVRDVLVRVDTTIAAQPQFVPAQSDREFKLLVSDFTLTVLMPHMLTRAYRESHTVQFQLLPQVAEPQRALERAEADLLVIPAKYCSPDHPTETLFTEDFRCVVWDESRFADAGLTVEDYLAAGHIVVQPLNTTTLSFEGWFMQRHGIARRIEVTTFSFAAAPNLVIGTDRIATVHTRLAQRAQQFLPIKLLMPPMPMPKMEQTMQWHKYRTKDPGLVWLRRLLHEAAEQMDAEQTSALATSLPKSAASSKSATSAGTARR